MSLKSNFENMMKKRKIKILIGALIMLVLGTIIMLPKLNLYFASESYTLNNTEKSFFIKGVTNLNQLSSQLKNAGIINNLDEFVKIGEYKGMNSKNIALGKYLIAPNTKIKDLLNGFKINAKGNGNAEVEVTVRFNNCSGLYQLNHMSKKVSESILVDSAALFDYINQSDTYTKYGFTIEQFPSMFMPNSYNMFYDTDEKQFVERMAKEFKKFWNSDRKEKLSELNLNSPSELYTLASLVYLEQSRRKEEWSDISKLYLNRLGINMALQSDPTFKYCWGDELIGVTRLLYKHRDIDCDYNTYKIKGLPPGPICLVNNEVLEAVLNPSDVDYLYMYGDGIRHYFSRHYRDHIRNTKR